ncbi:hypothetical protein [Actinotignum sanguinis]|nr:hypothetical protein [Actinotignum sanguinis]MDK8353937.1 hypothetical protein [Actinotignum sanguinis]
MMALLDELARLAPDGVEVPYVCSAYLAWWVGQNSMTALRAQEALEINPGSRLARMLKDAAAWNALPPWLIGPNEGGRSSRAEAGGESGGAGEDGGEDATPRALADSDPEAVADSGPGSKAA